jgi:serine/threonine-protein kinase
MQSGQRIRDYLLEEKIGEGGMGEVWRALHIILRRQVAIKVMSRQIAADPLFGERFLQEAQAQAVLQHPHILGVTDFFSEGNIPYLVMPLVIGQSLDDRMKAMAGPLPMEEALTIARDILAALDYAHQHGIIHRDVKPSNILLDKSGYSYLMDFGIALLVGKDRVTRTGSLLGTREYMSPEQVRNPRALDHRTDVYSSGCLIYEMMAGRPPFLADGEDEGSTDFAVMEAHVYQQPESIRKWNPAIPAGLDAVVLRALAKKPNQRFGGCGEFRRALENWDRYQAPAKTEAAPPPPPAKPGAVTPPIPVQSAPTPPPMNQPTHLSGGVKVALFVVAGLVLLAIIGIVIAQSHRDEVADDASTSIGTDTTTTDTTTTDTMTTELMVTDMGTDMSADMVTTEPMVTDMGSLPEEGPEVIPAQYASPPVPVADEDGYDTEVINQLEGRARFLRLVKDKDYYFNTLAEGKNNTVEFTLEEGVKYTLMGACDRDCSDIDIALLDEASNEIAADVLADDYPTIVTTPGQSGRFFMTITMADCAASTCVYGVGVYRTANP